VFKQAAMARRGEERFAYTRFLFDELIGVLFGAVKEHVRQQSLGFRVTPAVGGIAPGRSAAHHVVLGRGRGLREIAASARAGISTEDPYAEVLMVGVGAFTTLLCLLPLLLLLSNGDRSGDSDSAVLELRNISKLYARIPAVDQVSFCAAPGQVTGYLGPNGSGKSTTMKMITGLIDPTDGEILFRGVPIHWDWIAYKRMLGYVPEEAHLYAHLTGYEYLEMVTQIRGLSQSLATVRIEGL
jgi:ABC-type multidrug transport system fused ATPase/permease subunit